MYTVYTQHLKTFARLSYIYIDVCGPQSCKQDGDNTQVLEFCRVLVLPISLTHSLVYAGILGENTI